MTQTKNGRSGWAYPKSTNTNLNGLEFDAINAEQKNL
jgi:hypothetical protein